LLAFKSSTAMEPADSRAALAASVVGEGNKLIIAPRDGPRKREFASFVLVLFTPPR